MKYAKISKYLLKNPQKIYKMTVNFECYKRTITDQSSMNYGLRYRLQNGQISKL